jgi:phosphate:Na+ symporter
MDWITLILEVVAGLSLFLYGVTRLSDSLQQVASERMKKLLARFTSHPLAGVATGTVATALLDSSSVTIIMVVALVNSGLLPFTQALGVIMGANIGTTISSQIIAFQLNQYASVLLAIGFLAYFLGKKEIIKNLGMALFGFGLIFFGLNVIEHAAEPLKAYQPFVSWMKGLENPWLGVLTGAAFTVLIQSSSATLGIIITLAAQGLISLPAGVAIMLGAEIGTCADTLVASLGRSRSALRAGIFHLTFNIITVLIGVTFAGQLAQLASYLAPQGNISRQIANAHLLFNLSGVLLFIWFVPLTGRVLTHLIPDKKGDTQMTADGWVQVHPGS